MVMTNFTIAGKRVTVIARLSNGKPVFDLDVNDETVMEGVNWELLHADCETIRAELEKLTAYWVNPGKMLYDFNETWRKEAGQDDQAESGGACGDSAECGC